MKTSILRLVASPPLAPHVLDDMAIAAARVGAVLGAVNDPDINASALSVELENDRLAALVEAITSRVAAQLSAGRAFRFEILSQAPEDFSEEAVRAVAVGLHGSFSAPIFIARREIPAAAWSFERPMPWGRKGLAVGQTAPTMPFGGSDCLGVAIEIGKPTVLAKARLDDVPEHGLVQACSAVGGGDSGFAEVAAYPGVSAADGTSIVVLEFGNLKRSPIHRTLAVLDIEARRYGGRLGQVGLLSHVPLEALLETLRAATGLDAAPAQVLETHLPARGSQ